MGMADIAKCILALKRGVSTKCQSSSKFQVQITTFVCVRLRRRGEQNFLGAQNLTPRDVTHGMLFLGMDFKCLIYHFLREMK